MDVQARGASGAPVKRYPSRLGRPAGVLLAVGVALAGLLIPAASPAAAKPAPKPECSDHVDNDGDGLVDFAKKGGDPDCESRKDATEGSPSGGVLRCTDSEGDGTFDTPPPLANATGVCNFLTGEVLGMSCHMSFHDINGLLADGCEYGPILHTGPEVCDGVDNNADGQIDEGVILPQVANGSLLCDQGVVVLMCNPGFEDANAVLSDGCEAVV